MPRREPAVRDTRSRVQDAALEVFAERGYIDTTIEEIAARAGLTKGAVYYYFADKDDLARELHRTMLERLAADAAAGFDPDRSVPANLEHCLRAFLESLRGHPGAAVLLRFGWLIPELDQSGRDQQESAVALVRALLDEGVARGELAPLDADTMARVLLGAFAEATLHVLSGAETETTMAVLVRVIRAFTAAQEE